MKKGILFLAFLFLIIIVVVITNPKLDAHKEAVSEKINEQVFNGQGDNNVLVEVVGKNLTDLILSKKVSIENYVLFSLTKLQRKGEKKTIGIGALGNVFFNSEFKESIQELNNSSKSKNTLPEPKTKTLDTQQIKEEPKPTLAKEESPTFKKVISNSEATRKSNIIPKKEPTETTTDIKTKPQESTKKASKADEGVLRGTGNFGDGHGDGNVMDEAGSGPGPGLGPGGSYGTLGKEEGSSPKITNPTLESGKVVIELTVDREGRIIDVKVLANHPRTTTSDPVLLNHAKKDGYKFKFKANPKRAQLSKSLKVINYTLQ